MTAVSTPNLSLTASEPAITLPGVNRVDQLLSLRGVACMIVLLGHCFLHMPKLSSQLIIFQSNLTWLLCPNASVGMYIFFTLSGYLMGNLFFSGKYEPTARGVLTFFRARFMRIAPLFYSLLLFYCLYDGVDFLKYPQSHKIIKLLTFTYNIWPFEFQAEHFWSIAVEMQFYLVVPLLFFVCRRFCKNGWFVASSLVVMLAAIETYRYFVFPQAMVGTQLDMSTYFKVIYLPLIGNLDVFFIGFWLSMFFYWQKKCTSQSGIWRICHSAVEKAKTSKNAMFCGWMMILFCYVLTTFMQHMPELFKCYRFGTFNLVTATCTSLFIFAERTGEVSGKNAPLSPVSCRQNFRRLFECVGVLSYGIYLWHPSVMVYSSYILEKSTNLETFLTEVLATTVLSILFATVTYLGIEKPINQLRYRLAAV